MESCALGQDMAHNTQSIQHNNWLVGIVASAPNPQPHRSAKEMK